jgi:hypothetical protein
MPSRGALRPARTQYQGWSAPTGRNKTCSFGAGDICRFALVDYAGVAAAFIRAMTQGALNLGTTSTGSVKVDPASGGCVQVTVKLTMENALIFVSNVRSFDYLTGENSVFVNSPLLFDARVSDVLKGAEPGLARSVLHIRYLASVDDPLPNLLQLLSAPEECEELQFLRFQADAKGTEGSASVRQVGLFVPDNQVSGNDNQFPATTRTR